MSDFLIPNFFLDPALFDVNMQQKSCMPHTLVKGPEFRI